MTNYETLVRTLDEQLEARAPGAFDVNAELARHPEVSGREAESMAAHARYLRENGMEVQTDFAGIPHAYFARVVHPDDASPNIAILAEYDALPEIGHACGHSASGALSLLAAAGLKGLFEGREDECAVNIDIIGTPDEEYTGQKTALAEQGVFDRYDFAMMIHMESGKTYSNYEFLALDAFRVRFRGASAHAAASPWCGKNALDAATLAMTACGLARQQLPPGSILSYFVVKGGTASNAIPDFAEMEFCVRAPTKKALQVVKETTMRCVRGAAVATDTTFERANVGYEFSDLLPVESGTRVIEEVMTELGIPFSRFHGQTGSSDIGSVSYRCPAFHPALAVADHSFALHTREMAEYMLRPGINDTIRKGARIIAHTVLRLACDVPRLRAIRAEFRQKLGEQGEEA